MPESHCLECRRPIGWLQRRRQSAFCSPRHEAAYHDRKLALDRLAGRVRPSFDEVVPPVPASAATVAPGGVRRWTRWFSGAAAGIFLVVIAVASSHARSSGRNGGEWVVLHLPDPPAYQESLPNSPAAGTEVLASALPVTPLD